ncbi:hypothetical protein WA026_022572 [Henosepilachna vigintioctopunctata]|uniref:Uncharacterized protein n=1 Tax=Henosepilachna vigintioctopunctata TaxID=420089 RepID=A0AAW1VFS9_9CUCU
MMSTNILLRPYEKSISNVNMRPFCSISDEKRSTEDKQPIFYRNVEIIEQLFDLYVGCDI